ncbi:hypothetical protein, partial [Deinococcus sp.]|uniref:hypothetical protein n=1 Tax=Deinococcus sp. TaxID=47478 RepID=UPI00286DF7E9
FGHPDEVILDVVHRMASGPVVHFQSLGAETSPAKAGGLNPTFRESKTISVLYDIKKDDRCCISPVIFLLLAIYFFISAWAMLFGTWV